MQKEIIEAYPKAEFSTYVVWLPMIPTDNESAARRSAEMYRDSRLTQYYDPGRLTGIAFSKDVKPDQFRELMAKLADDDPLQGRMKEWFAMAPEDRPVWDVVYFFPPGVKWTDSVPRSMMWTKQMAFFGDPQGDEPSGLFFRQDSKEPPAESDWFIEIRQAMLGLMGPGKTKER